MAPETDVIGTGAAGARLAEAGVRAPVLEGASRRGGRVATDRATLGMPFDLGCHWLRDARANPFTSIARTLGFAVDERDEELQECLLHPGSRFATPNKAAVADCTVDAAFAAVTAAVHDGHMWRQARSFPISVAGSRWPAIGSS